MFVKHLSICLVSIVLSQKLVHAQEAAVQVWAVPGIQKVREDDRIETKNLVWSATTKTITVAGARNEHVPFQVVISTPPPPTRYDKAAESFFAEISDLASARARIPKTQIKCFARLFLTQEGLPHVPAAEIDIEHSSKKFLVSTRLADEKG